MPIVIEREGKTVSEATMNVCDELGLARDELVVEVLEEGSRGVLGIGSKNAKVRVTVKSEGVSEKGLRAKKALETILGFFVPAYSTNLRETPDKIRLDVKTGENRGLLIGKKGEMLRAMEYIIGKIAGRTCGEGREKRVSIDVEGYKKRRESNISRLVKDAVKRVRATGRPFTFEALSAFERRIVYMTLKNEEGIKFETRIDGDEKKIIITSQRRNAERNRYSPERKQG